MKLKELKPSVLDEGMVEPNVMMSIENIVARGYANNTFEYICLVRLLQMMHNGTFYKEPNILSANLSTSAEGMAELRKMAPEEIKKLAEKVLALLVVKDEDLLNRSADNTKEFLVWLDLYRKSGANE